MKLTYSIEQDCIGTGDQEMYGENTYTHTYMPHTPYTHTHIRKGNPMYTYEINLFNRTGLHRYRRSGDAWREGNYILVSLILQIGNVLFDVILRRLRPKLTAVVHEELLSLSDVSSGPDLHLSLSC